MGFVNFGSFCIQGETVVGASDKATLNFLRNAVITIKVKTNDLGNIPREPGLLRGLHQAEREFLWKLESYTRREQLRDGLIEAFLS